MKLAPTIAVAAAALARNMTRSLLTLLGVVLGAKARVAEAFEGMGTATL